MLDGLGSVLEYAILDSAIKSLLTKDTGCKKRNENRKREYEFVKEYFSENDQVPNITESFVVNELSELNLEFQKRLDKVYTGFYYQVREILDD